MLPALLLVGVLAAAPVCEDAPKGPLPAFAEAVSAARNAHGEWREDAKLPWAGDWLDVPRVLGGLSQQDHLRATKHDEEKCGAMTALAAALTGGEARFTRLLDRLDAKARGADRAALATAREHLAGKSLTARDLHLVSEALYRVYVGGKDGSTDGDISTMVRASGRTRVETGAKSPRALLAKLSPGECFPLNLYLETPEFTGWHVVLVWKDAAGVARVYDSDRFDGTQVFGERRRAFDANYLDYVSPIDRVKAEWLPGTKFE